MKNINDQKFKGKVFDPEAKLWSFRYGTKTMKVNEIFRNCQPNDYTQRYTNNNFNQTYNP